MRTPVALPRMQSSYHLGGNLISDDSPNSQFGDLGVSNLSITVFWHFPEWEVPLYGCVVDNEKHYLPKRYGCVAVIKMVTATFAQ